jgi:hypothetical protein
MRKDCGFCILLAIRAVVLNVSARFPPSFGIAVGTDPSTFNSGESAMNTRACVTGLGLLAGIFAVVLTLASWTSSIAATPGQSGPSSQSGGNHPEIRHALKSLREARYELKEAKHDFGGHREDAVHAVDEAIRQLEVCLQSAHNGEGSASNSQSRQNRSHLSAGS